MSVNYEETIVKGPAQARMGREQRAMVIIALVLAVGAIAVAIVALSRSTHKTTVAHPVSASALAALTKEVGELKSELATAKNAAAKQQTTISKLTTCVPELTSQINGLSVETNTLTVAERQFLTSAFLKNGAQVSSYCRSTLEPPSQAPH